METQILKFALWVCTLAALSWYSVSGTMVETRFRKTPLCNIQDRINNGCFVQVSVKDRLPCLVSCSRSATCDGGVIISSSSICFHEVACGFVPVCAVTETNYVFYMDIEHFDTTVVPMTTEPMTTEPPTTEPMTTEPPTTELMTTEPMTTEPPTTEPMTTEPVTTELMTTKGTTTECTTTQPLIPSSCGQFKADGYSRGTYPVNIDLMGDSTIVYQSYCTIGFQFNSFEVLRSSGSFDNTLTYNDYVNGFCLGPNDFFIGLEALHRYTSDGGSYRVTTKVWFHSSTNEGYASVSYNNFVVQSASSGYQYTVDIGSGSSKSASGSGAGVGMDDMLSSQKNTPFSTADHDVDGSASKNCAQLAQAGWWFNGCSPFDSNPLGWNYITKPGATTDSHFYIPGYDTTNPVLRDAFQYFTLSLDE